MREIKFRGKCAFSGIWVYGYYYPSKGNHIIRNKEDEETIILIDTLGEYSGVDDIRFIKIFEGDIIKPIKFNDVPNVVKHLSHGFYRVKKHGAKEYVNTLGSCKVQKLGNIFDNPELLENN